MSQERQLELTFTKDDKDKKGFYHCYSRKKNINRLLHKIAILSTVEREGHHTPLSLCPPSSLTRSTPKTLWSIKGHKKEKIASN